MKHEAVNTILEISRWLQTLASFVPTNLLLQAIHTLTQGV